MREGRSQGCEFDRIAFDGETLHLEKEGFDLVSGAYMVGCAIDQHCDMIDTGDLYQTRVQGLSETIVTLEFRLFGAQMESVEDFSILKDLERIQAKLKKRRKT